MLRSLVLCLSLGLPLFAQDVIFLEPISKVDTSGPEVKAVSPLYRRVDDARYRPWLDNDAARRALRLYLQAFRILEEKGNPQRQPREYYVALVPDGNHAAVGFRVQTGSGVEDHSRHAYILLGPSADRFQGTMLHETGHVAMAMLAGGRQIEGPDLSSIPHSTAALTDRATAFSEGWAIHLETLAAHYATDPGRRGFFHERVLFGDGPYQSLEYFRHAADLASYSQNLARYTEVRDNNYAFQPAYRGSDYLRIQLEKARDFAELREPNQLLQSEGFYASFFFLWIMRGEAKPAEDVVAQRHERLLRAMSAMFARVQNSGDTPWLLELIRDYLGLYPDEKPALVDAFNDLSHGVFVDPQAASLWRAHYLAALYLDIKAIRDPGLQTARRRWREQTLASPDVLFSRVAPQIRCEVKGGPSVKLEAFGEASPLILDVNTAPEAILHLVPGLDSAHLSSWLTKRPFASREAFEKEISATLCSVNH